MRPGKVAWMEHSELFVFSWLKFYFFPVEITPVAFFLARVILMELSLQGSGITYEPGDAIGIRCPNSTTDAEYVLKRLEVCVHCTYINTSVRTAMVESECSHHKLGLVAW